MKTKTLLTKVVLLGLLVCGANQANASTLNISGGDGNPTLKRFDQYSASLTASVPDPPQDTTEAKISGPTYLWTVGGSGYVLSDPKKSTTYLYATQPYAYASGGQQSVSVTCTATFTSTDRKTGTTTPIPVPGPKTLQFFVVVPDHVQVVYGVANNNRSVVVDNVT